MQVLHGLPLNQLDDLCIPLMLNSHPNLRVLGELAPCNIALTTPSFTSGTCRGNLGPPRLPANRGVPDGEPRPGPVPTGDYDTGAATLKPRSKKQKPPRRANGNTRPSPSRARARALLDSPSRRATTLEAAATWHRTARGGEQAALGDCLLAAMDAADHIAGADERLRSDPR